MPTYETPGKSPVTYEIYDPGNDTIQIEMDDSVERNSITIAPDDEAISSIVSRFPQISPEYLRIRFVSFFDTEYGISTNPETEVTTITLGANDAKGATRALSDALVEITNTQERGKLNKAFSELRDTGLTKSAVARNNDIANIADMMTPLKRSQRKMAKKILRNYRIF